MFITETFINEDLFVLIFHLKTFCLGFTNLNILSKVVILLISYFLNNCVTISSYKKIDKPKLKILSALVNLSKINKTGTIFGVKIGEIKIKSPLTADLYFNFGMEIDSNCIFLFGVLNDEGLIILMSSKLTKHKFEY